MSDQTRYLRLAQITQLINSNFDLRAVLEHVVTAISEEIIQCTAVGIYLAEPNGTFRGSWGNLIRSRESPWINWWRTRQKTPSSPKWYRKER